MMSMAADGDSNELLYHYTDPQGFSGIIENKNLWATNAAFLNDTQEMTYGADLIAGELSKTASRVRHPSRAATTTDEDYQKVEAWSQVLKYLQASYNPNRVPYGPYVVCFSRNGDDLGQWRGYATSGYSIGFDRKVLVDNTETPGGAIEIKPVHYGAHAKEIAVNCVSEIIAFVDSLSTDRKLDEGELSSALAMANNWIPQLKHEAFIAEAEERLWVNEFRDVKFRPGGLGLVPYKEVPINLDAIREIIIGPGPNQDLRANAIHVLLEQRLPCNYVEVWTSEIPFRG